MADHHIVSKSHFSHHGNPQELTQIVCRCGFRVSHIEETASRIMDEHLARASVRGPRMADPESQKLAETLLPFGHWTMEQLDEARRIAVEVMQVWGDLVGDEYERFLKNPWNDHCSVQAALRAMPKVGEQGTIRAEVDRLRRENERLREALGPFAAMADEYDNHEDDAFEIWRDFHPMILALRITVGQARKARTALSGLGE